MIEYIYLTDSDIPKLVEFFTKSTTSKKASDWMMRGLTSQSTDIVIVAEILNGNINGIVCGCTITYWINSEDTFLPIWLAVRMDRLPSSPVGFGSFIKSTSRMLTSFFERKNCFQHYIIRRLPKKYTDLSKLQEVVNKSWGFYPYIATVESVINSNEDFKKSCSLFKAMINTYHSPVVVLSLNIDNATRKQRLCSDY
jgi:hypothetical protein